MDYAAEVPLDLTCRYTGSDVRVRDDGMPLAHVALAVEGTVVASKIKLKKANKKRTVIVGRVIIFMHTKPW